MSANLASSMNAPPGFALGPLTTYADPQAMADWLAAAEDGNELVYATGPTLGEHAVARLVRSWIAQGLVDPVPQRRAARANCFDYAVRRKGAGRKAAAKPDHTRAQLTALLRELRRCAAKGEACPSLTVAAKKLHLPGGAKGRRRAQYLFDRLVREKRISVTGCGRNAPRVVTILAAGRAQGKSTKGGTA